MIFLTDPICSAEREEHLAFNRKLTTYVEGRGHELVWAGDKRYGQSIFASPLSVSHKVIDYRRAYGAKESLRRYRHVFKSLANSKGVTTVIFLGIDNTFFSLFCILFRKVLAGKKVICILHNNLYGLSRSPWKKRMLLRAGRVATIEFVVLTKVMKRIADELLETKSTFLAHPFFDIKPSFDNNPDVVTFLSVGRQAKAFWDGGLMQDFLAACRESGSRSKLKLVLILPAEYPPVSVPDDLVDVSISCEFLNEQTYRKSLSECDFFLFPDLAGSEYRASGTLMDTLSNGRIFIAPGGGHFSEYEGCGVEYGQGGFRSAIKTALNLTREEIAAMREVAKIKRREVEEYNKKVFDSLIA